VSDSQDGFSLSKAGIYFTLTFTTCIGERMIVGIGSSGGMPETRHDIEVTPAVPGAEPQRGNLASPLRLDCRFEA
jgi:hypothetical protein